VRPLIYVPGDNPDPAQLAHYLIDLAGGVQAAHKAVTRAGRERPRSNDDWLLMWADAVRRHYDCSSGAALGKICRAGGVENKAMLRRLQRMLREWKRARKLMWPKDSLVDWARNQPCYLVLRGRPAPWQINEGGNIDDDCVLNTAYTVHARQES
jgi:hypothetical protein